MNKRTDLALEATTMTNKRDIEGVTINEIKKDDITISTVNVTSDEGARTIGKSVGKYITISSPSIKYDTQTYENTCKEIGEQIRQMTNINKTDLVLVVGLGNENITPDALGNRSIGKLLVTNHLKKDGRSILSEDFKSVCAIAPGVLGTTGMETVEIVKGVSDRISPSLVIVIDALASAEYSRIGTTFQLSDSGIEPGAGVGNNRKSINRSQLGTEVIAIGVPTVIDAVNLTDNSVDHEGIEPLIVTPRDIDLIIERCAKTIAGGINLALHDNMTLSEFDELVN